MQITLKTLQQQTIQIEIDPVQTVKALKEKIEAERGKDSFPVSGQKLIYAGKILQDDTPIQDYNIDEKNFVVVMVSKAKPAAAASPPASEAPKPPAEDSGSSSAAAPAPTPAPTPAAAPTPPTRRPKGSQVPPPPPQNHHNPPAPVPPGRVWTDPQRS
ncbi:hypothetical protein OYC64_006646 [Pagothenia borchgrevinki]|uniref:Ubiquitin-like domain-containing protein n=1 Tax=Pagothenia borchgrevinki TaxID=8213 RepID=A0ABD2GJR8_PAGBO